MQLLKKITPVYDFLRAAYKKSVFSFRTLKAIKLAKPVHAAAALGTPHVPILIRTVRPGYRVYWLPLRELKLTTPFFDQAVQRRLVTLPSPSLRYTSDFGINVGAPIPTAFIFHISRCGSTLLANVLRSDPRNVIFAEPALIHDLVDHAQLIKDRNRQSAMLRGAIDSLMTAFGDGGRKYFFKFPSLALLELPTILDLYPEVPWVFLMRDPLETAASNLERPPSWLADRNESALVRRILPATHRAEISPEEIVTKVLAAFFQNALSPHVRRPIIIDYTSLTADQIGPICTTIGASLADIEPEKLANCFLYHAKSEGRVRFVADGLRRRSKASENLVRLIDAQVRPSYEALKRSQPAVS